MKTRMSGMGNKMMGNSRLDIEEENLRDLSFCSMRHTIHWITGDGLCL